MKRLHLLLRLRWVRGDIAYAEAQIAQMLHMQRQVAAWVRDEEALLCQLATLKPIDWRSAVFACSIGAALALTLIYGPT